MNDTYASHALFLLNRTTHLATMRAELERDHGYPHPAPAADDGEAGR